MKIRRGFVSNSSTSCFVCAICGGADGGHDVSAGELGFIEFPDCYHTVCESHVGFSEDYQKKYREYVRNHLENNENEYERDVYESIKDIEDFKLFKEEYECEGYEIPDNIEMDPCPVCNLSHITSDTLLEYILKSFLIPSEEDVKDEIRRKFKNLNEVNKFLKE